MTSPYPDNLQLSPTLIITAFCMLLAQACDDHRHTTWSVYRGDAGNTAYSSLDQINRENV